MPVIMEPTGNAGMVMFAVAPVEILSGTATEIVPEFTVILSAIGVVPNVNELILSAANEPLQIVATGLMVGTPIEVVFVTVTEEQLPAVAQPPSART